MVSFAAFAEPDDRQYDPADGSTATGDTTENTAPDDDASGADFVSQGSTGGDTPEARAARRDLAEEERLPDYSQVVDNSSKKRFVAPGWTRASGDESHGEDYALARAGSKAKRATFRVKIPTSHDYAVYAWWSAAKSNATDARFVISTASGPRIEKVNQTKEGGMWIKLGAFAMKKGERTVRVSSPSGGADVVADAVAVVRGEQGMPPEQPQFSVEGDDMLRATSTGKTGKDIVRRAKRYVGKKYRYATCTNSFMSCTCETKRAVRPFGHRLPMTEKGQWNYEPSARVRRKSNLKLGDIVFFREGGGRITHVGVFSGRGNIVHASSYFGKVVESKMKYVRGYTGAIRVNPR